MNSGFTSTSLRKYSIEEVVKAAVKSGASVIEWGSDYHIKNPNDAKKARALCDEFGIKTSAYGSYYRIGSDNFDEWERLCENATILDAKCIRTWLGKKGSKMTSEKEYSELINQTMRLSDKANEYGLIIANECHPNTYNDTTESSIKYLEDVGRENVRTYYQSWYRNKKSDLEKLDRLFNYITDVHISFSELKKFQMFHKKDPEFIKDILQQLAVRNFNGNILIEFTKGGKLDSLINDVYMLRSIIEKFER